MSISLAKEISRSCPALTRPELEPANGYVTDQLYNALSIGFEDRLLDAVKTAGRADVVAEIDSLRSIPREYRRAILRFGSGFLADELASATHLSGATPPDGVHSMVRQEFYCGDFYHCDMITEALGNSGICISPGQRVLDFGASSGRVVRTMQAAFPKVRWLACDPQGAAIEWATQHLDPRIQFCISPLMPPIEIIPSESLSGVFAISIWSHFSEDAALAWFAEMRRLLRPGGWLLFTTHGLNTLRHYAEYDLYHDDKICEIVTVLRRDLYAFVDAFGESGDWSIPSTNWGMCWLLPSWVALNLVGAGWGLTDYRPGRSTSDQDLYLLHRQ
jgi:SAM-dependent methyltransferase